jgi:hypothetical protein
MMVLLFMVHLLAVMAIWKEHSEQRAKSLGEIQGNFRGFSGDDCALAA